MTRIEQYLKLEIAKCEERIAVLKSKEQLMPSELMELGYMQDQIWMYQEDLQQVV